MSDRAGDDAAPAGPGGAAAPGAGPRAIRVSVAATTRLDGDPTVVVEPPDPPAPGLSMVEREPSGRPLVDGQEVAVTLISLDAGHGRLVEEAGHGGRRTAVLFGPIRADHGRGIQVREVVVDGWRVDIEIEPERRAALRERARRGAGVVGHGGPVEVRAIIPGRVVAVSVAAGETVEAGQQILVVEAMKMQNELRAPREGTVERIGVAVGDTIDVGDLLVVIH